MIGRGFSDIRLSSGPPWQLEYNVERIGTDYLCRIHGGDRHIGAMALSRWRGDRVKTECLVVSGHKERGIAVDAAHMLCSASKRQVGCLAGIHFDSLTANEVGEIVQTVHALTRQAAARLEQQRLNEALDAPDSLLQRIRRVSELMAAKINGFFAQPLAETLDRSLPRAVEALAESFGNQISLFAPLYLSNACSNDCIYCGFRKSARFDRTHLSIEEALREAGQLAESGHRTIDLVTGEVATDRFVDYVCKATRAILEATAIRRVNLNLGALTAKQFRRLRDAGAEGYHLYQETYAPHTYFQVHARGLKRDMAYRLAGPHRAAEAGFEAIGLGALLGLHAIGDDLAALAAHARILTEDFPGLRVGFSLPRLQDVDTDCAYSATAAVSDDDFLKAMLFLRVHFPKAHLTVTTRERAEVRDRIVELGVTRLSAGVSTSPGGYTGAGATGQFDISDRRSLTEVAAMIQRSGRTVTYG